MKCFLEVNRPEREEKETGSTLISSRSYEARHGLAFATASVLCNCWAVSLPVEVVL